MTVVELRYERGAIGSRELEEEGIRALAELIGSHDGAAALQDLDIEPSQLESISLTVKEDKQGLDPTVAEYIVTVGGELSATVLTHLFVNVIWKQIRRRKGADALGKKKDSGDAPEGNGSSDSDADGDSATDR